MLFVSVSASQKVTNSWDFYRPMATTSFQSDFQKEMAATQYMNLLSQFLLEDDFMEFLWDSQSEWSATHFLVCRMPCSPRSLVWQVLHQMRTDVSLLTKEDGGSPTRNPSTATEDARVASLISLEDIYKQTEVNLFLNLSTIKLQKLLPMFWGLMM